MRVSSRVFKAVMAARQNARQVRYAGPFLGLEPDERKAALELLSASPSQLCAAAPGVGTLAALSRACGKSSQTLINWHTDSPQAFDYVLMGAVYAEDLS